MSHFKMLLLRSIIVAFIISVASSSRNYQCHQAMELISNKSLELMRRVLDNMKSELMKVCCSDFSINIRLNNDEKNSEDEIENHPNLSVLPKQCGGIEGFRIIGGSSPSLYEFPWLALISYKINGAYKFNCGGSVINDRYVLTAAHCIKDQDIAGVRIGEYDISTKVDCYGVGPERVCESKVQDITVAQKIIYPEFHNNYYYTVNVIGLLRLKKPVNFSHRNAGAICLPVFQELRENDLTSKIATVAGWGVSELNKKSSVLLKVTIPITPIEKCKQYERYSRENRFGSVWCAGADGRDACKGDSGSPLMLESRYNGTYKFVQDGIVSYGSSQCGTAPGVYTDVRKFMKWILDSIKP